MGYWHRIRNPIVYQGNDRKKQYFEGWYFKFVDSKLNMAFAVIPGIAKDESGSGHAFIQVINGIDCSSTYHEFILSDFSANKTNFEVQIGSNFFGRSGVRLSLPNLTANLKLSTWSEINTSIVRPGIMGWYSYMPFMQCYHGLGSMNHFVSGAVDLDGSSFQLTDAKGYLEKDWGTSFPKAWIWNQCNNFDKEDVSVFASVAHIPWMGTSFIGFLSVIYFEGKCEVFATYTGAKRITSIHDDHVELQFKNRRKLLSIMAYKEQGADLKSPISGNMTGKVNESLKADIEIRYEVDDIVVYEGKGQYAGLEIAGDTTILLT